MKNKFNIWEYVYVATWDYIIEKWVIEVIRKDYYEINFTGKIWNYSENNLFKTLIRCKNNLINRYYNKYIQARELINSFNN